MLGLQNRREVEDLLRRHAAARRINRRARFCSNAQRNQHRSELQALIWKSSPHSRGWVVERLDAAAAIANARV